MIKSFSDYLDTKSSEEEIKKAEEEQIILHEEKHYHFLIGYCFEPEEKLGAVAFGSTIIKSYLYPSYKDIEKIKEEIKKREKCENKLIILGISELRCVCALEQEKPNV